MIKGKETNNQTINFFEFNEGIYYIVRKRRHQLPS